MKATKLILLFAAIVLAAGSTASATLVDAFVGPPTNPDTTRNEALAQAGFGFYLNNPVAISRLGFWVSPADSGNTGVLAVDHKVALYNYNNTDYTQIAEATVPAGSTADANGYAWATIPYLPLTDTRPGLDYYILTAEVGTDVWAPFTGSAHAPTLNAAFGTRTGNAWFNFTAPMPGIGNTFGAFNYGGANGGFFGPNIGVPEPSSLTLLGLGTIALIRLARRRSK